MSISSYEDMRLQEIWTDRVIPIYFWNQHFVCWGTNKLCNFTFMHSMQVNQELWTIISWCLLCCFMMFTMLFHDVYYVVSWCLLCCFMMFNMLLHNVYYVVHDVYYVVSWCLLCCFIMFTMLFMMFTMLFTTKVVLNIITNIQVYVSRSTTTEPKTIMQMLWNNLTFLLNQSNLDHWNW